MRREVLRYSFVLLCGTVAGFILDRLAAVIKLLR